MESIHQKMKMYRKDMEDLGMIIVDVIFCVALLKCSNTDESSRMNIESVAKNNSRNDTVDPTILENIMRSFTPSSEQAAGDIEYVRGTKKEQMYRKDMEHLGMIIVELFIFCVALLKCSNTNESTRMNIESVAKNNFRNDTMDPTILENIMRSFTPSSEQAAGDIEYVRGTKKEQMYRKDMEHLGMIIVELFIFCVALLKCSNTNESTRMNIESVAKNNFRNDTMDPTILENIMRSFTPSSEQAAGDIEYVKGTKKEQMYRKDMEHLGMIIVELFIFCVALLKCSNTDESTRMNIESVAKNNFRNDTMDPTILENIMRSFTPSSEQAAGDIEYVRGTKKEQLYRKDMEDLGMIIVDVIFCVALLKCSNTDESTRMNIESVAKNNFRNDTMDPTILENIMRSFTPSSEQAAGDIEYVKGTKKEQRRR